MPRCPLTSPSGNSGWHYGETILPVFATNLACKWKILGLWEHHLAQNFDTHLMSKCISPAWFPVTTLCWFSTLFILFVLSNRLDLYWPYCSRVVLLLQTNGVSDFFAFTALAIKLSTTGPLVRRTSFFPRIFVGSKVIKLQPYCFLYERVKISSCLFALPYASDIKKN